MGRAMEIITDSTYPKLFKPSLRRLFLFVTSIARTNLEAEIIQRGGTLCSNNTLRYKPRRECLGKCNKLLGFHWACAKSSFCLFTVPLLNLLSVNLRLLGNGPLWQSFVSLYEIQLTEVASVPVHCNDIIPSLLIDPIANLIKYTLLAPLRMDLGKKIEFRKQKSIFNIIFFS